MGVGAEHLELDGLNDIEVIESMACAVVDLLGPERPPGGVQALLSLGDLDSESLLEGLEVLLDLPELGGTEPERSVVLTRWDPAMVRLAAAVAGPTWILPLDSGWNITIPTRHQDAPSEALATAVSAATKRRDRSVLLWKSR